MPTYEYVCRQCGEPLEVVQSFTDDTLTVCPNCGGDLKKVFGNIGIVFKGSGFYKTDSRSSSKSGKEKADSPAPATAEKSSAETTSSKSDSSSSGSDAPKKGTPSNGSKAGPAGSSSSSSGKTAATS
jgi:putative FmdB family regulatory protein